MERDFGSEMVRAFSARLRRMFDPDERILPERVAVALEELKRAEQGRDVRPGVRAAAEGIG